MGPPTSAVTWTRGSSRRPAAPGCPVTRWRLTRGDGQHPARPRTRCDPGEPYRACRARSSAMKVTVKSRSSSRSASAHRSVNTMTRPGPRSAGEMSTSQRPIPVSRAGTSCRVPQPSADHRTVAGAAARFARSGRPGGWRPATRAATTSGRDRRLSLPPLPDRPRKVADHARRPRVTQLQELRVGPCQWHRGTRGTAGEEPMSALASVSDLFR